MLTMQPPSSPSQPENNPTQTDSSLDGPDQDSVTTTASAQVDPVAPTASNSDPPPLGPPLTPVSDDDDDDEIKFVHASGRSRTKEQRLAAVGKKSGHPGRFTGASADYLQGFVKQYEDIMRTYGGKSNELEEFYVDLRKTFWETFKWQEIREMYGEGGRKWDKGRTMRAANDSIKGYYTYRWTRLNGRGDRNNPFKGFAKNLRKPTAPRPKSVTAVQLYLSENIARVNELYTTRKEDSGRSGIALRTIIAKELLLEEDEETQGEWARRAKEANQAADETYREQNAGAPSDDPEDQEEARNRLVVFLKPFWSLLTQYTGLRNFTLLAGNPPEEGEEEYLLAVVSSGKTAEKCPRHFHLFDPEKFEKQVLGTFMEYLQATKESGGAPAAGGGGGGELPRFRMHGCEDDSTDGTRDPEPEGAAGDAHGAIPSGTTSRATTATSANCPPGDTVSGATNPRPKPKPKPRAKNLQVPEWAHLALRTLLKSMSQKDMEKELERLNKIPVEQEEVWSKENRDAIWRLREVEREDFEATLAQERARKGPRDEADYVPEEDETPVPPASPRVTRGRVAARQSQSAETTPPEPGAQTALAQSESEAPLPQDDRGSSPTPPSPTRVQRQDGTHSRHPATLDVTGQPGEFQEEAPLDPKAQGLPAGTLFVQPTTPAVTFPASVSTAELSRAAATFAPTASTAGALGIGAGPQASPSPPAPCFDDLPDNAQWIEEQYDTLVSAPVPPTYEYLWKKLLADWVELERALGFGYARSGFTPTQRPAEIGDWIQRARAKTVATDKAGAPTYKARWTAWWSLCNPGWRVRDDDGHPAIGGAGDWSTMLIPGKNGWINIISSLVCLGAVADVEDWARSMLDVQWVVQEVLAAKLSEPYVRRVLLFGSRTDPWASSAAEGDTRPDSRKRGPGKGPKGQPAAKRVKKTTAVRKRK
ncbi:hypothetical protein PsYK624_134240 [Phanerochaete sordida]|uniref:Uncharacterized protein n=1 Tax=Phanerochaete sordida TaxID=48140 RepID=A0A9P3LJ58_9APHY|nr:hypothetical protein PsYK624_134240 [Phanerochaete sordida]